MKKLIFVLGLCLVFCLPTAALAGCGTCAPKAACGSCIPGVTSANPGTEYYGHWESFRTVVKTWNEYKTLKEHKASSSRINAAWNEFVAARRVHAEQRRQYIMNLHVPSRMSSCKPGCQKSCCKVKKCEVSCQKSCCQKRGFKKFHGKCNGNCQKANGRKMKKNCSGNCATGSCKSNKSWKKSCGTSRGCPAEKIWKKNGCSFSKKKCGSSCRGKCK